MIDLHCHSSFSDGDCTPNELLKKAELLNLTYFSITDHNNCFAYENLDTDIFKGTIITGIEIVTSFEKHIIEILGYGVDIKEINEWSRKNQKKEKDYAEQIYDILIKIFEQNKICYTKNVNIQEMIRRDDPTGNIKQYIYNDLLKYKKNAEIIGEDILHSYANFNKKGLNNPNSLIFINEYKRFPKINEVVNLIHENNGLCFLAHLYQYNVDKHIEFLNQIMDSVKLDGVETYHSSFSEKQTAQINEYAMKVNLYRSGGSDFHGKLKPGINLGLDLKIPEEIIKPWVNKIII